MEKINKVQIIIIIVCSLLVVAFCGFLIFKNGHKEEITDAMRFKEEYEVLNDSDVNDKKYPSVEIPDDNPIVYKTPKEILEVLKNEDAIVYFGFSSCPWCRNIVETLIQSAKDNNIEKVYYVDIKNIRDNYKFTGSIIPEQTVKGTDAYYEILNFFGNKLEEYYVKDEKGNEYDTGVTRLYAPTVIAVSDGKIKSMHVATVESQKDPYVKINEEQQKELKSIFDKLIETINNTACSIDGAC